MQRAVIIHNPTARNAPPRERLQAAVRALPAGAWQVDIVSTEAAGHGTMLAREAARAGANAVFACGGDGTINEVVNGLAGSEAALGVLRGGMGDVFAREAGIPKAPEPALVQQLESQPRRFDLGRAGERYFLLMAGIGIDASVVRAVPPRFKRHLGSASYALWGIAGLTRYQSRGVLLRIDGVERESRLYWLLLGNTRSYGGVVRVTGRALVDDGLLDAYVFEGGSPAWLATTALRLAAGRQDGGRGVTFEHVRDLEVLSPDLPVQVDGEYIGETPMRFRVAPGALRVLLPGGKMDAVFSQSAIDSPGTRTAK